MSRAPPKPKGLNRVGGDPITIEDVRLAGEQAAALLDVVDRSDADLLNLGISRRDVRKLERAADLATFKMPSARAFMLSALGGGMSRDVILTNYHRALQAIHGMAPFVAWKLAEKLDDENAAGSTRVLIEVANGIGLLTPAAAVSTSERFDAMDFDKLKDRAKKDPAALKAEILAAGS